MCVNIDKMGRVGSCWQCMRQQKYKMHHGVDIFLRLSILAWLLPFKYSFAKLDP